MGKTQSKRSVDITTETNKNDDEVTEKMEKIEETDRREINGDTPVDPQLEKKINDDAENEKDAATEKRDDAQAGGDSAEPCKSSIAESNKEDGTGTEEISPLTDESAKKSKKEKVKKKWSFRSISFGKKDKQKPLKPEESTENIAGITNGTQEENASQETDEVQKEKDTAYNTSHNSTSIEGHQNGNATEKEKIEKQTEEMSYDVQTNEETGNTIKTTAEKKENKAKCTAENEKSQETNTTPNTPSKPDDADIEKKSEEKNFHDASTNGNGITVTVMKSTKDEDAAGGAAENKDIPADLKIETVTVNGNLEEIHQNGSESHKDVEESKAQIEVKTNNDKASADSLEIISSTCNDPPNVSVYENYINKLEEKIEDITVEKEVEPESSSSNNELCKKTDSRNYDENFSTELNMVVQHPDERLIQEPSPPPLPISPPPSHVSVFAFNSKDETKEKSGSVSMKVDDTGENIRRVSEQSISTSNTEMSVQDSNKDAVSVTGSTIIENYHEEPYEDKNVTDPQTFIKSDGNALNMDNIKSNTANENNEEINNSLPTDGDIKDVSRTETKSNDAEVNNVLMEGDDSLLTHDLNSKFEIEKLKLESDVQIEFQKPCSRTETASDENSQSENENIQSPNLEQSQSDDEVTRLKTHHEEQVLDKTVFDKIDNLVREETKDITNTKDLKESAVVTEPIQDPAVTCE